MNEYYRKHLKYTKSGRIVYKTGTKLTTLNEFDKSAHTRRENGLVLPKTAETEMYEHCREQPKIVENMYLKICPIKIIENLTN